MLGPLGHIAALLAYVPRRRTQAAADASTHRALAWARSTRAANLPAGLELEWLGTAGFRLTYHGQHLLIDPYRAVTRVSPPGCGRRPMASSPASTPTT